MSNTKYSACAVWERLPYSATASAPNPFACPGSSMYGYLGVLAGPIPGRLRGFFSLVCVMAPPSCQLRLTSINGGKATSFSWCIGCNNMFILRALFATLGGGRGSCPAFRRTNPFRLLAIIMTPTSICCSQSSTKLHRSTKNTRCSLLVFTFGAWNLELGIEDKPCAHRKPTVPPCMLPPSHNTPPFFIFLQGREVMTTRCSCQGVVAHEALLKFMCTGCSDPVCDNEKEMKDSTCTAQPAQRRGNWRRVRFRFARIMAFLALLVPLMLS